MENIQDKITIMERLAGPTPKFFAIIRNIGIIVGAVSAALASIEASGVVLPEILKLIADKAVWIAGLVAGLVSQFTVDFKALGETPKK